MPYIESSVGVSESENHKSRIDSKYTLNVFSFFLNIVGVDGSICAVTDVALPVNEVHMVVSSHNHGVCEQHLLDIGERTCGKDQQHAEDEFHLNK